MVSSLLLVSIPTLILTIVTTLLSPDGAPPHTDPDPCLPDPGLPLQPRQQGRGYRYQPLRGGCHTLLQCVLGRASRDPMPRGGGGRRGEEGTKEMETEDKVGKEDKRGKVDVVLLHRTSRIPVTFVVLLFLSHFFLV
jgi:hypothetical protein